MVLHLSSALDTLVDVGSKFGSGGGIRKILTWQPLCLFKGVWMRGGTGIVSLGYLLVSLVCFLGGETG